MTDSSPAATVLDNLLLPATLCFIAGAALAGFHLSPFPFLGSDHVPAEIPVGIIGIFGLLFLCRKERKSAYYPNESEVYRHFNNRDNSTALKLAGLFLFFSIVGFMHTWLALQPPSDPSHIYNRITEKTQVTLEGEVTGLVTISEKKSTFVLSVSRILYRKKKEKAVMQHAVGKIRLSMRGSAPASVFPGQTLLVVASVDRIHNYQTPGTFNYVLYMRNKGIFCSGWIKSSRHILAEPKKHLNSAIDIHLSAQRLRQHIDHFLRQHCDNITGGLYRALLIGNRSGLSRETIDHFALTGCMHLLAISGLHMGLLALLLYGMVYWLLKRSQWLLLHTNAATMTLCLTFPVLFGYAFIAGLNAPVFRALIMAGFFLLAVLCNRQHSLFHLLAAAALVLLTLHPLALFTVSFQLSFAALIAIALITPYLHALYQTKKSQERKKRFNTILRRPLTAFLISLAATAGTLPLLLYHFNRFSPIGPLMNLIVEPLLCFIALPLGLLAIPLLTVAPESAKILFSLGGHALHLANSLTARTAQFSLASIWTITPSIGEIVAYYLLLILLMCRQSQSTGKNKLLILGGFILLFLHFTAGLYLPKMIHFHHERKARVSFLDVGKGSSTLLEFADGTTVLIDGGGSSSDRFNVGRQVIAPFLWKQRVWRINTLIITHPDSDHYNGLEFIVDKFHLKNAYINDQPIQSHNYKTLINTIKQRQIRLTTPQSGQILHADSLCRLTCIGMTGLAKKIDSDNNQGLVMKLDCGKKSFLFPADIEQQSERILLNHNRYLRADVLLAPHHGSKTSCSHPFLREVDPKLIVVSAGGRQQKFFPASRHRRWWRKNHIPFLITGINGAVFCTTDGKKLTITTWRHETAWESREISQIK